MKIYFAAALICTVSLLTTGCRRPLDDVSAPLNPLTLEARLAPVMPALAAVDVGEGHGGWGLRPDEMAAEYGLTGFSGSRETEGRSVVADLLVDISSKL